MEPRLNFFAANPDAMKALAALDARIARSALDPSLVALVRLRTSQLNGCAYCIDVHASEARVAGESERRLATLAAWRDTPFFTPREGAALAWAEAVTRVAETHVPDEVWTLASAHFTPAELVDLTLLVGSMNAWNRFAVAFRKQPGSERARGLPRPNSGAVRNCESPPGSTAVGHPATGAPTPPL